MRIRSWLSRACLTTAAALTALALVAPPTGAQPGVAPEAFGATGFASAIQAMINTDPQTFVADLVRFDVPHGQSQFGGDGEARSRAASIFPGVGAQEGPALGWGQACGQGFPCEEFFPDGGFPPPYPLTAEAENPTVTEARPTVEGQRVGEPGGPFSFTIVEVVATATDDEATTTAVIADLDLLPVAAGSAGVPGVGAAAADPATVHIKQLVSTTRLRLLDNELVAEAESRLSGISLFGGAIQIDELTTRSVSRADADGHLTNEPQVTVEGVTAGDVPLVITNKGIAVAGETIDQGGIQTLSSGVGALFGAGPLSVRLIDSTEDRRQGIAKGSAVGLSVHFEVNASGFPSGKKILGDLILGTAATTASASGDLLSGDDDIDFGDDEFFTDDGSGLESFGGGGDEFTFVAGETIEQGGNGESQAASGIQGARTPQQARFAPLEALLQGVAADRITLLYVAWTLALLGLAFGSRLPGIRFATRR